MATGLLLLGCVAFFQGPLDVDLVSGVAQHGKLRLEQLGLGTGGMAERERWAQRPDRDAIAFRTVGGARIAVAGPTTQLELPSGVVWHVDARARVVGADGPLHAAALGGLALRLADGTELRVVPGGRRGAREVAVEFEGREYLLARAGRLIAGVRRARAFHGLRYYVCGDGADILELVDLGPCLWIRSLVEEHSRMLVLGDVLRAAVRDLQKATPRNSAQYPLAAKHAAFLNAVLEQQLPAAERKSVRAKIQRGAGFVLGLGPEIRCQLAGRGPSARGHLAFSIHLGPGAPPALEFIARPGNTSLHRVLPKARQTRSRYLGRGVDAGKRASALLPWPAPLANAHQRRAALAQIRPWLATATALRR